MNVLITAGPTREPIDAVRYIGNRSSGRMGAAIASAAVEAGHAVTLVLGPVSVGFPKGSARRIDVETAAGMHAAVMREFPAHALLIMAAAVADFRPKSVFSGKLKRSDGLVIECEPTEDILAAAGRIKRSDQRTVGFSLEAEPDLDRTRAKLVRKGLDLIVYNPAETMNSATIAPVLLWPDGRTEMVPAGSKEQFGRILVERAVGLFGNADR